jgi:hypothetical protein
MTDQTSPRRFRLAALLALPIVAVAILVLAYRYTAPRAERSDSSGAASVEGDVLKVGALPVT